MLDIIIYLTAGTFGGIITGLIGLSAVDTIAPLLVIFLNYNIYTSISLSLASDVFSSIASTYVFYKNNHVKPKYAFLLVAFAFTGIIAGSFLSKITPSLYLLTLSAIGIILAGIRITKNKQMKFSKHIKHKKAFVFIMSLLIGFIAGYFGAGGGLMILTLLVLAFNFKIHDAVGTSVLSMTFIALFGAVFHYTNIPFSLSPLIYLAPSSFISAYFTSKYANKLNEEKLSKIAGYIITLLGVIILLKEIIKSLYEF